MQRRKIVGLLALCIGGVAAAAAALVPMIRAEEAARASRIETPPRSRTLSALSTKVPATARLPSSVEAKRTPSSSAKPTTSIANGNRCPRRFRSVTQEIAVINPSGPSHLPASRTVS